MKQRKSFISEPENSNYDDFSSEIGKRWYEEIVADPQSFKSPTDQILIELQEEAKTCYDSEVAHYNIKNKKNDGNHKWMKTVMFKGIGSDKIAACTIAIQDNPVYSLDVIQNLVNMVKVGKKDECTMVMDVLTELFLKTLLRSDQKLKEFSKRPLTCINDLSSGNAITRRKILSFWYFEDKLKQIFANFIMALNKVAQDVIDNNKEKSISAMATLLNENPEQEQMLLTNLVNKLGDPSQKVASKTIYSLGQILFKHPNMQGVVLNEVEKLLFRSNVSQKSQYYGLCFLSQFYLSHERSDVAQRLVEVYFSFFKACIKKGEVDSRMMSALLMGVNRAYPYAKLHLDKISDHINTIYRVVHIANFNISLHALSFLFQVSSYNTHTSDRFYSALYRKLADPKLLSTTHQAMLLSLIFKAILNDTEGDRIKVFIKRLLQLALLMVPSFACGILFLVSQLISKKKNIQSLILKQTTLNGLDDDDDDEEKYCDVVTGEDDEATPDKTNAEEEEEEDSQQDREILSNSLATPSWDHSTNAVKKDNKKTRYNSLSRNPLYAGGNYCAYTELVKLKNHFHPTVALYATNILEGNIIKYSGDPLKDFTLIRFLDRFVYKNPKKQDDGTVYGAHPTFGKRKLYKPRGIRSLPINSASYLQSDLKKIPVDELFMYSFLRKKYHEESLQNENDESDLESVQSEEFEEMLDKMANIHKDEDLDFLNEVEENASKQQKTNKKGGKREDGDDSDLDENDDFEEEFEDDENELTNDSPEFTDEEDDDLEMNDDDKELLGDLSDEDDNEEVVFDEKKKSKGANKSGMDVFASAEEFASLLDDEGTSKIAPGSSNAFSNKDRANTKQVAWEDKRNRWLQGFNNALGKKNNFNKSGFKKKRKNHNQNKNNSKKLKRNK